MRVWVSIGDDSFPLVCYDVDMSDMNVFISLDEMSSEDGAE